MGAHLYSNTHSAHLSLFFCFCIALAPKTFFNSGYHDSKLIPELNDRAVDSVQWTVHSGCSLVGKGTIWPALVQWLLAGGGMKPVGTWVVVAQQGRLVLQLAPKCPIFHGSAEPSATDACTHGESTSLPVLYSLLMTTHIIVIVAGEARQQWKVSFTLSVEFKSREKKNALVIHLGWHVIFSDLIAFKLL